ncbi:MAG TPA: GTP-binding protein, partial [archaeon]|nr:GTP-binding protein [archaeon]
MAVPITIITGFLGSGKTTLLQNLLRKSTKKLAILMNEFGAVDIDAKIIRGKNVNIIELAGGCVCCSMAGEFEAAVREILEKYSPDHIVVETTGVAEPDALALDVQSLPGVELDAIICIADADSLVKFPSIGHTSRKQIEIADLILLNKTDLVEDSDIKEIIKKLEKLNKKAEIIPVQNCEIEPELVLGLEVGEREIEKPKIHAPEFVS